MPDAALDELRQFQKRPGTISGYVFPRGGSATERMHFPLKAVADAVAGKT